MGLDTVETVLWAEKEFEIEISDVDAAKILSIGQFTAYIHAHVVLSQGFSTLTEEQIFQRMRAYLVSHFAMRPEWINREAEFVRDLGIG